MIIKRRRATPQISDGRFCLLPTLARSFIGFGAAEDLGVNLSESLEGFEQKKLLFWRFFDGDRVEA